ncbi:MAG TPA: L-aspartate oxidase [Jatrophihabitans sp.]|nr:L-aspartate oxidase [Jatrophihabitans sp.]
MTRTVDVLVIGSGVAGLSTALGLAGAREVMVLTAGDGSSPWAQGGVAAAFGDDDPLDHQHDTAIAGVGMCNERNTRALVEEGPLRVAELITLGAALDRRADGSLSRTIEGGHGLARVVHAGGDATGAEVHRTLSSVAAQRSIQFLTGRAVALTTSAAGGVTGAVVDVGNTEVEVRARAVVLATGGIGNAYLASTNPPAVRGDGLALALAAGATLVDMEFVQFHPTALYTGATRGQLPLVTEAVRGEGAVLRDGAGRAIMAGRHRLADLAPRDVVAREIEATMRRDRAPHVWLDATGIAAEVLRRRFPTVMTSCAQIGVDMTREPIPVAPAEHFLCGGVRVDRNGATDVPGLYAVGEVAATGVHGANRLASNSMLEGMVFGRRVAAALTLDLPPAATSVSSAPLLDDPAPDRVRAILSKYAGIRRDAAGLAAAAEELAEMPAGSLALVARSVVAAATARVESRGCHWRTDHPHADPRWQRHLGVRLTTDGRITALPEAVEAMSR